MTGLLYIFFEDIPLCRLAVRQCWEHGCRNTSHSDSLYCVAHRLAIRNHPYRHSTSFQSLPDRLATNRAVARFARRRLPVRA